MSGSSEHKKIGVTYGILASALWGGAIVLSKYSLDSIDSNSLFFVQISSAFSFSLLVGAFSNIKVKLINYKGYALGFFEPYLAYVLALMGLSYIGAGEASIIFSTETIFIVLISIVFHKKGAGNFTSILLLLVFAFVGVCLILEPSVANNNFSFIGLFLVLSGALSAAIYVVLSSKLVVGIDPLELITGQLLCAFILSLFFVPYLKLFGLIDILLAAFTGVIQYFLAFYFYLKALKYIGVNLAGMMLYLIPFFAFVFSVMFLDENYGRLQILGGILVLISIFLLEKNTSIIQ